MAIEFSEQEQIRRNSLQELYKLGIDPYPAETFETNISAKEIKENFKERSELYQDISIAGRIMSRRIMGAASFTEIQDSTGRIQLYFKRDEICTGEDKSFYNIVFKRLLDMIEGSGLKGKMGGCYHTSSGIPQILRNTGLEAEFKESSNGIRLELNKFENAGLLTSEFKGNKKLFKAVDGKVREIYLAGDCAEPRGIMEAIDNGFSVASAL